MARQRRSAIPDRQLGVDLWGIGEIAAGAQIAQASGLIEDAAATEDPAVDTDAGQEDANKQVRGPGADALAAMDADEAEGRTRRRASHSWGRKPMPR